MSSLKKIFTVIDDVPYINPVGINIPCFKALYLSDKTPNKSVYANWLAFIYHMVAYDSCYYDIANKTEVLLERFTGRKNTKVPVEVTECIKECIEMETFAELRALSAAIQLSDNALNIVQATKKENEQYEKLIKAIDKEIAQEPELSERINLMNSRQALQKAMLEQAEKSGKIISNISKNAAEITMLRKQVSTAHVEFEANNKNKIESQMVDDFIGKYINNG